MAFIFQVTPMGQLSKRPILSTNINCGSADPLTPLDPPLLTVSNSDGNHSNNAQDCALGEVLNLQVFNKHEDYTDYSVCIDNVVVHNIFDT
jgi:hypothetical protein